MKGKGNVKGTGKESEGFILGKGECCEWGKEKEGLRLGIEGDGRESLGLGKGRGLRLRK